MKAFLLWLLGCCIVVSALGKDAGEHPPPDPDAESTGEVETGEIKKEDVSLSINADDCTDFTLPISVDAINATGANEVTAELFGEPDSVQCFKASHDLKHLPPIAAINVKINATAPHILMMKYGANPTAFNYDAADFCSWLHSSTTSELTILSDADKRAASFFSQPVYIAVWWRPFGPLKKAMVQIMEDNQDSFIAQVTELANTNFTKTFPLVATMTTTIQFQHQLSTDTPTVSKDDLTTDAPTRPPPDPTTTTKTENSTTTAASNETMASSSDNSTTTTTTTTTADDTTTTTTTTTSSTDKPSDSRRLLIQKSSPSDSDSSDDLATSTADFDSPLFTALSSCHMFDAFVDLHTLFADLLSPVSPVGPSTPPPSASRLLKDKDKEKDDAADPLLENPLGVGPVLDGGDNSTSAEEDAGGDSIEGRGDFVPSPPPPPPPPSLPSLNAETFSMLNLKEDPFKLVTCADIQLDLAKEEDKEKVMKKKDKDSAPTAEEAETEKKEMEEQTLLMAACDGVSAPASWEKKVWVDPGIPTFIRVEYAQTAAEIASPLTLLSKRQDRSDKDKAAEEKGNDQNPPSLRRRRLAGDDSVDPHAKIFIPGLTLSGITPDVKVLGLASRAQDVLTIDSAKCAKQHQNPFHPAPTGWLWRRRLDTVVDTSSLSDDNYGPSVLAMTPLTDGGETAIAVSPLDPQGRQPPHPSLVLDGWIENELRVCAGKEDEIKEDGSEGSRRLQGQTEDGGTAGVMYFLLFSRQPTEVTAAVRYRLKEEPVGGAKGLVGRIQSTFSYLFKAFLVLVGLIFVVVLLVPSCIQNMKQRMSGRGGEGDEEERSMMSSHGDHDETSSENMSYYPGEAAGSNGPMRQVQRAAEGAWKFMRRMTTGRSSTEETEALAGGNGGLTEDEDDGDTWNSDLNSSRSSRTGAATHRGAGHGWRPVPHNQKYSAEYKSPAEGGEESPHADREAEEEEDEEEELDSAFEPSEADTDQQSERHQDSTSSVSPSIGGGNGRRGEAEMKRAEDGARAGASPSGSCSTPEPRPHFHSYGPLKQLFNNNTQ
uniref:Uncharacterized protein n=1 Tax=Chromera velia CCMP2878 TaxID=1169474 RepID=A0A0G4ICI9_9ALVE|eukprot:Cvel_13135.t1-p1 / transcript=Cvel_13135.t1 / gene=Cvel_13135 / organism=Chromera_velia_CCMP2878 / gene_product=hypothetical protein / transcript_product=hypothetical protein / location=Cvel_scaffold886:6001-11076(-) / protein_length=1049 / sequence_SO=supercontig / SO=protein_coding / is_pseudo=false